MTVPSELAAGIDRLAEELDSGPVPGIELAVVADGEVLYQGGLGVAGVEAPQGIGPSTWFHHGSCGKAYTGLLAAILAREGALDLDAPVRHYLPDFAVSDRGVSDRITTRDLLSHRAGLARHDLIWIANPSWDRAQTVRRLPHLEMAGDLRGQWVYSNFGYMAAGLVIERASGSTWEDQLNRRLLGPAGLERTTSAAERVRADADHARPHVLRDGKAVPTAFRVMDAAAPAGGLSSCAADSARWLLLQTATAEDDGPIPHHAITDTHEIQMALPATALALPHLRVYGYGLGWVVGTYRDQPVIWHNGGIDGFKTDTLLLVRQRIGVLASANLHASPLTLAVALDLADRLLGRGGAEAPDDWYQRLSPRPEGGVVTRTSPAPTAAPGPVQEVEQAISGPEEQPAGGEPSASAGPSHRLDDYAGVYEHPGYGRMEVKDEQGRLAVRYGEIDLSATHRHYDTWDLWYPALDLEVSLTFVTDPEGRVAEAVAPMDPSCAPIRFGRRPEEGGADKAGGSER